MIDSTSVPTLTVWAHDWANDEADPLAHRAAWAADQEDAQIRRANASGRQPVVFVHGLWLLPSSWERWAAMAEEAGYVALLPGWPDDPASVDEANAHPEAMADKTVGQVADHVAGILGQLERKPVVIGHSFGGLIAQILAGRRLSAATVALGNPANRHRAVPLTYEQFRFAFANAVGEDEARRLHATYAVPAAGAPVFQAAAANLNPWTQVQVDTHDPERGPLLIVSGEKDHTVPWSIANASFKQQRHNPGLTEIVEIAGRGHSLTIDDGWREVAETVLAFVGRFAPPSRSRADADRRWRL
jgi:non-heme chloroperoxidase